jgi:uncharacterized membrane protein
VRRLALGLTLLLGLMAWAPAAGATEPPVVRAVLFFSPSCGHCDYVINTWLFPVWFPQYGGDPEILWDQSLGYDATFYLATNGILEVLFVDVTTVAGSELHHSVGAALGIPEDSRGYVPRLVVDGRYLIGSADIPDQFPGIIEAGLASGGIDWPDVPGIAEALAAVPGYAETTSTTTSTPENGSSTSAPVESTTTVPSTSTTAGSTTTEAGGVLPEGGDTAWDNFRRDPAANSLALVVLVLMVLSLAGAGVVAGRVRTGEGPGLAVPLLALAGLGVAIYLAFIETSGSQAVCGPVGDCNAVQQSEWARVFGVIPVGVIGVAGYALVLGAWAAARWVPGRLADWARVAMLAGALAGVAFSVYLTFLEPFVIGATCMWCLGSAVIVTALLWLSAGPGGAAGRRLFADS